MIEVRDIVKSYGDTEILHGLNFDIERGQVHAFLGRNGAGKTTFIRGFMNIFKFNKGTITIDGRAFRPRDFRIGYLPEERGMYQEVSILDQLIYFSELRGVERRAAKYNIMELLERLDLGYAANNKLKTLSKGNQQKVQLIQSLMNKPEIIILDEPFSGLDPVNSQVLQDLILDLVSEDTYMIFSSHQMSHVENICENLTMIDHGDIVLDGNIGEIKKERGMGRVFVKTEDDLEFLQGLGYELEKRESKAIVSLGAKTKEDLLADLLAKKANIKEFGDYLPSLNEIYIETVGD